ncbi:MAG: hypothetical protein ACHP6I_02650, partial [Rickettsiales bacterium]
GLNSLTVNGTSAINTGTITTTGIQDYSGNVTLGSAADLSASGTTFGGTLGGDYDLTLNGPATFNGAVSGLNSLTAGVANINASVSTVGAQSYSGNVNLGGNLTTNNGSISFTSPLTLTGNAQLSAGTAAITLANVNAGAYNLTFAGSGGLNLGGNLVSTTGALNFARNIALLNNISITSTSADMSFAGITNNKNLTLDTTGNINFNGDVNGLAALDITNAHNVVATAPVNVTSFTESAGTGTTSFSDLSATGDISIDPVTISGTYSGVNGNLNSHLGTIDATVSFDTLAIEGAGATLHAGYIGAPGATTQAMANLISVNGVSNPNIIPSANFTFGSYDIGYNPSIILPVIPTIAPVIAPITVPDSINNLFRYEAKTIDSISDFDQPETKEKLLGGCSGGRVIQYTTDKCVGKDYHLRDAQ